MTSCGHEILFIELWNVFLVSFSGWVRAGYFYIWMSFCYCLIMAWQWWEVVYLLLLYISTWETCSYISHALLSELCWYRSDTFSSHRKYCFCFLLTPIAWLSLSLSLYLCPSLPCPHMPFCPSHVWSHIGSYGISARCAGFERRNEGDHRQVWEDERRAFFAAQTKPSTYHENHLFFFLFSYVYFAVKLFPLLCILTKSQLNRKQRFSFPKMTSANSVHHSIFIKYASGNPKKCCFVVT